MKMTEKSATERNAMDAVDTGILRALQRDSSRPIAELAAAVGLSPSACHRRVKLLEKAEIITGYSARLDRRALGMDVEVFVEIMLDEQSEAAMDAFEASVASCDAVVECCKVSGGSDYMLRVVSRDIDHFEQIHRRRIARLSGVARIHARFVLRTVKGWQGYPVPETPE